MSVYLFVPSVFRILLRYSTWAVATFGRFHSTLMGNLARDVLFRMPACDVIRYTLYNVTSIDEHDARTSSCNNSETTLTNPIEYMYPPKYLLQTKGHGSANCTWIMHVNTRIVCCGTYSFFLNTSPEGRERERERAVKMRRSLRRERMK